MAVAEMTSLVLNLCSESNLLSCSYDNTDLYRRHARVENQQNLRFRPPGFPRCR